MRQGAPTAVGHLPTTPRYLLNGVIYGLKSLQAVCHKAAVFQPAKKIQYSAGLTAVRLIIEYAVMQLQTFEFL